MKQRSTIFYWMQLLRLPNIFTAIADVSMGFLVTHRGPEPYAHFALLIVASCLLYSSGMVLNDVFDAEVDAIEQPSRPIPANRISRRTAAAVGWTLLICGMTVTWLVTFLADNERAGLVGTLLATCIVLYDRVLKRTPIAPLVMGACRSLNVLLGMSLASDHVVPENIDRIFWGTAAMLQICFGIGVYVAGVTWFARTDTRNSSRRILIAATIVLLAGMAVLAALPYVLVDGLTPSLRVNDKGWYLLWFLLAVVIGRRCGLAIMTPTSQRVQVAVRHCVQSLIMLNATLCLGYAGAAWGFTVLTLMLPTAILTARIRAT